MTNSSTTYLTQLHQLLDQYFNLEEVRTLCLSLNVDYESVPGAEKPSRIRELLLALGRNGRLPELITLLQQERPNVNWPPVPNDFQPPTSLASGETAIPPDQYRVYGGNVIHGDVINRDKITVGDVSKRSVVAVGAGARAEINHYTEIIVKLDSIEDAPPAPGDPPYKGLAYFTEKDTDIYYGRKTLSQHVATRLNQLHFLALIGASGSGKSSLLRAGIIPRLRSQSWCIHLITPGAQPLDALANSLGRDVNSLDFALKLKQTMLRNVQALYLIGSKFASRSQAPRLLLAVDQFEEVFTQCHDEHERRAFIENLLTAANKQSAITVMIGLRADFYDRCAQFEELRELVSKQQEFIGPMKQEELVRVIAEPAKQGGWQFVEGLVEQILEDAGDEPGRLPLLSHALRETWERRRSTVITLAGYRAAGGVEGAIAKTAEETFSRFDASKAAVAQSVFLSLTELGEGSEDTRRIASLTELKETNADKPLDDVLQTLVNARLITISAGQVEVAHEALIRRWPRLHNWLADNRERLRFGRQLAQDAQEWEALGKDVGALYRGARLQQAIEWSDRSEIHLSSRSARFLGASRQLAEREAHEKEAQRQREVRQAQALAEEQQQRAEAEQKRSTLLRRALVIGGVLTLFLLIASILALVQTNNAQNQARFAESERIAAVQQGKISLGLSLTAQALPLAENKTDQDDELATLLALEALRLNYETGNRIDSVVDSALRPLLTQNYYSNILDGIYSGGNSVAFSISGEALASIDNNGAVWFWDMSNPNNAPIVLKGYSEEENTLTLSPETNILASGNKSGVVRLWHLSPPTNAPIILEGNTDEILSIAFGSNGNILAAGTENGEVLIWDVSNSLNNPTGPLVLVGHSGAVNSVAFTPDGQRLASGSMDGSVRLWQVANPTIAPVVLEIPDGWVWSVAFSPDGEKLAVSSLDHTDISPLELGKQPGTVWLWQVSNLSATPIILEKNDWGAVSVAFSSDAEILALGGSDGSVRLLNLSELNSDPIILKGHRGTVEIVAFTSDKTKLFTSSSDGTVRLWHLSDPSASPIILDNHLGRVFSVAFSPSGEFLASASSLTRRLSAINPGNVRLWRVADPASDPIIMDKHQGPVFDVEFSSDGATLASTSMVDPVWLWQANDISSAPSAVLGFSEEFFQLNASISSIEFSPDGKTIASYSFNGMVVLWDTTNPITDPIILEENTERITSLSFAPNGINLAAGTIDGSVQIWDITDPINNLVILKGNTDVITSVSFSPNGNNLAAGTATGKVLIWDLSSLTSPYVLEGHQGSVRSVTFSPNGKTLASGSDDRTVRLWQVSDFTAIPSPVILRGYEGSVMSVAFAPDGTMLATGSADGTAKLWIISLDKLAQIGCTLVRRNLTWGEWQRFLPTEEVYNQTCRNLPIHPSVPVDRQP